MPRPISTVHITPDFEKAYLRLPKHIQNLATRKDQWFRKDAFDPSLRTHKLKGELSAYWAYSVNREYRVLFRFLGPSEVLYMMLALMRFIASIASDSLNDWNVLNGWNDLNRWSHRRRPENELFMGKLDQHAEGNQKITVSEQVKGFNVLQRHSVGIRLTPRIKSRLMPDPDTFDVK